MVGTPAKERTRKMRAKRAGRSLSVWLYPPADTYLEKLRALTGEQNNAIVAMALESAYEKLFWEKVGELSLAVDELQDRSANRAELVPVYRELIAVLAVDYPEPGDLKTVLNQRGVPNMQGDTGKWRVEQVRRLMS